MDPESKRLLQNTLALVEENNKMLRKVRRSQKITTFLRVVYWVITIGIAVGAFYFLQPFISQIEKYIQSTGISIDQFKGLSNMPR